MKALVGVIVVLCFALGAVTSLAIYDETQIISLGKGISQARKSEREAWGKLYDLQDKCGGQQ